MHLRWRSYHVYGVTIFYLADILRTFVYLVITLQVEIDGRVFGKGIGSTWDDAKTQVLILELTLLIPL